MKEEIRPNKETKLLFIIYIFLNTHTVLSEDCRRLHRAGTASIAVGAYASA